MTIDNQNSFQIIFEDDHFVAINKPCGILVHRTPISEDKVFVLQLLRDQIGQRIYPIHRLDRATSGVLIFGKNKEAAGRLSEQMREKHLEKIYRAIIRGFVPEKSTIDYAIKTGRGGESQEAITHYERLAQVEINRAVGPYNTARYSYVEIQPETGRRHQIRRHFAHLRHPIIGDKKHGDVKHNKFFANDLEIPGLLLHAKSLGFEHPYEKTKMQLEAPLNEAFQKALSFLGFA